MGQSVYRLSAGTVPSGCSSCISVKVCVKILKTVGSGFKQGGQPV